MTESRPATRVAPLVEPSGALPVSASAAALAAWVLSGEGTLTQSVDRVGGFLTEYPGADLIAVSLTQIVPERRSGWVHLGERAWLREWSRPGTTCSVAPRQDSGAEQALSMPWVSQRVRHHVVVVADAQQLPPEAQQDRHELTACGIAALITSGFISNGAMYGSLAMGRGTPGPWPEQSVADLRLLSVALASRISEAKARDDLADAIRRGDLARASQQEFFSTIGHELRTPIAAIVGTAEMLGADARDLVEARGQADAVTFSAGVVTDADVVLSAGEHLLAIVDDLLNTGQELGGGVESQFVDVAEAVSDVVHWLRAPSLSASVTITAAVPAATCVLTTPSGLRQILTNLVGNAVAYNVPGGTVRVTTSRTRDEFGENRVRISVHDTGPGLTAEQVRDVFTPFVRFAAPETKGTGLGLSLSRSLAERDGGMMGVESEPGEGSIFWVDLPAAPDPPAS